MSKERLSAIEFYKSVEKTDPKMIKRAKVGGINIAAIDPQYQTELATKAFNSLYGNEWGIKDIEFLTRTYGEGTNFTEVMTLKGVFYYPDGDFEYRVSGKSFYISKGGYPQIDTEIEKKLLTNFKSKCLSILGFNADVFKGMFDDSNYVNEMVGEHTMIIVEQLQEITKLITDTQTDLQKFNKNFGINKTSDLPISQFNKAIAMLNAKKAKLAKETKNENNK